MSTLPSEFDTRCGAMQVYLLGQIEFQHCLELQQRLAAEIANRDDGQIVLLLAEHPAVITIGRGGSPQHVVALSEVLRKMELEVHWVNRGGGCMVHVPGQLAVYAIVPLRWYGLSVGRHLDRLQLALTEAMRGLNVRVQPPCGQYGLWARTGQFAMLGIAVRNWVAYHGAFINVEPAMGLFRLLEAKSPHPIRMTSLVAEVGRAARMASVRAAVIGQLAAAFGCDRCHVSSGVPAM
jgi:lipoyl(octanoyl) transferase